jgi:hypothetical protein
MAAPCMPEQVSQPQQKKLETQFDESKTPAIKIENLGLKENGYIKLLNVYQEDYYVRVVFKAALKLKRADREKARICIDYYDINNMPIGGESMVIEEYKTLVPDQTKSIYFSLPKDAKNYKVWLPEFK